jgi:alpha-glucosidase
MGDAPVQLPEGEVLVASAEPIGGLLPPDSAAWVALG